MSVDLDGWIWGQLLQGGSPEAIVNQLASEHGVEPQQAAAAVRERFTALPLKRASTSPSCGLCDHCLGPLSGKEQEPQYITWKDGGRLTPESALTVFAGTITYEKGGSEYQAVYYLCKSCLGRMPSAWKKAAGGCWFPAIGIPACVLIGGFFGRQGLSLGSIFSTIFVFVGFPIGWWLVNARAYSGFPASEGLYVSSGGIVSRHMKMFFLHFLLAVSVLAGGIMMLDGVRNRDPIGQLLLATGVDEKTVAYQYKETRKKLVLAVDEKSDPEELATKILPLVEKNKGLIKNRYKTLDLFLEALATERHRKPKKSALKLSTAMFKESAGTWLCRQDQDSSVLNAPEESAKADELLKSLKSNISEDLTTDEIARRTVNWWRDGKNIYGTVMAKTPPSHKGTALAFLSLVTIKAKADMQLELEKYFARATSK